jgi:uncharacterized protein (UPF0261 family)/ABC-type branched-subunit amino acid transport system ATPase component
MPDRERRGLMPTLRVRDLHVLYGQSRALQGVELTLDRGILSVVGRNGMGKTTLCKAIMGLVKPARGSIQFERIELTGLTPSEIANAGVGYVPQGRRLWRSLTVDEHLRLSWRGGRTAGWTIDRVYTTFPRLAERRHHHGGELSGGEQQMLAIARALLGNPRLLIMDEPTEGLAPVIVTQIEEMLLSLAEEEDIAILVIEQNIGVASAVSEHVAVMVNGRINRVMDAMQLAADRELQQRLLGVGRHAHDDTPEPAARVESADEGRSRVASFRNRRSAQRRNGAVQPEPAGARVYLSNPTRPTRWSQPADHADVMAEPDAPDRGADELQRLATPAVRPGSGDVLVVGTFDTKATELKFIRDCMVRQGLRVRCIDLSTSGKPSGADVPPNQVAAYHRRGPAAVFTGDRGTAVREMAVAFENWIGRQHGIAGMISAGGSGGTALATPAMRRLPIGIPKIMISTMAAGDVRGYVGASDIMMMHSVTDIQGLNGISRMVLANGANALVGMVRNAGAAAMSTGRRPSDARAALTAPSELPAVGLTMFGVTTPCVRQVVAALDGRLECLVFHATGIGGQSMEKLVDSGMLTGVIDVTTTEVCDLLMGGVLAATEDRFGAVIRTRVPYVGSCGALDMINFGPLDTVPAQFRARNLYQHNPQVTLMRTTPEECERIGRWIGDKLNLMEGPVRFLIPEGGVSAIDAPGQPFHDPTADQALFTTLERTVRPTYRRQLIRLPHHINDKPFSDAIVEAFGSLAGRRMARRGGGR